MTSRNQPSPQELAPAPSPRPRQPRYLWLRDCLLRDIRDGKYPVSTNLPTEEQLATQYEVSRHTVREATRHLVQSGLISRRRSTGTVVIASQPNEPYVAALGTLQELMQYTHTTRLEVFKREAVVLDEPTARQLGVEPGSQWVLLHSHRHRLEDATPISLTLIYLRPEYAEIVNHIKGQHPSIFNLHEMLYSQPVASVIQKIDAALLPSTDAHHLGISPTTPALKMTRSYLDEQGRAMSASINFYLPQRFELITRWDRDRSDTASDPI